MVLCKYFSIGLECPFLPKCPDEHLDIKEFISSEMEAAINGDQWPLSSFGPFTDKPSIPNYIDDQSFEEIRFMYYCDKNFFESSQQFSKAIMEAKNKMQLLLAMNSEVLDIVIDLYDSDEPCNESVQSGSNPFALSFAQLGGNPFRSNIFGGPVFSPFGFGTSNSFGGSSKSPFGQNSVTGFGEQPQSFGSFSTQPLQQVNAFNANAFQQQASLNKQECVQCKEYLKQIATKMDTILNAVNESKAALRSQQEEIKALRLFVEQRAANEKTNANAKANSVEQKKAKQQKNIPPLVIKPKRKQSSVKTKEEIKDNIDPFDLSIQIDSVLESHKGSVVIKCKNEESIKKVQEEIKAKCGGRYDVKVLKLQNPKIVVNGIDAEVDEDDLIEVIRKQNQLKDEIKLVKCFEKANSGDKYNAIIEVTKGLYKTLMEENEAYFNIGWNKCLVFDNTEVKRCFNCWGFNHYARSCKNRTKCPKCGGEHADTECRSHKLACTNCTKANVRLNLKLDVRHDTRNYNCHEYLKMLQKQRHMIDY